MIRGFDERPYAFKEGVHYCIREYGSAYAITREQSTGKRFSWICVGLTYQLAVAILSNSYAGYVVWPEIAA